MRVEELFQPLSGKYCDYFYYSSVISFVLFVIGVVTLLIRVMSKKFKVSFVECLALTQPFFMYFVSRLHYSICVNSLV